MNCPKCNCSTSVKSGKIKDKQRYKCKKCGCNYTVEIKSTAKPKYLKKQAFAHIIPKEKHVQSKKETLTVEGYNSLFRHFLARMRRKSKCYSKKMKMLVISVLLLMHYRNKTLCIFN